MELINQATKKIMEECKTRAKAAGLKINEATLEYVITNREAIELSAKMMIPTLYDYWVHDVEVLGDKWLYEAFPHNPYETVINTRPAISFYNDNNPDWFNVMIFYHVLGHIDFFQTNIFFRKTWDDDFCGQALSDKRLLNKIREELGSKKRWVDYVIEFARSLDNLVGYYAELGEWDRTITHSLLEKFSEKIEFYFGKFLEQKYNEKIIGLNFYYEEMTRHNQCQNLFGPKLGEAAFFEDEKFRSKFPEFNEVFLKHKKKKEENGLATKDILQFLIEHSAFINKEPNKWMKDVIEIVRRTSLYFQPQIRTKICNEGWASLWHERLFITDERITSHEVDFARVNSSVLLNPRIGLNPYIIGKLLFEFIEEMAKKGKFSLEFQLLKDSNQRKFFDQKLGEEEGRKFLFETKNNSDDFRLINFLSDVDFQDFVDRHNLFVTGIRPDIDKKTLQIFIKSRDGKQYRQMLNKNLYHPPCVINKDKSKGDELYLEHVFEGRMLITKYIPAVLRGLAFLSGTKVNLETTEFVVKQMELGPLLQNLDISPEYKKTRVLYTCEGQTVNRTPIDSR